MGGAAGTRLGFGSGVATGAVSAGAGAIALFKLLPLGQIVANYDSYIAMLNGVAIFALVTLCSLLIYGQIKDLLSGSAFTTLNIIVYALILVIVLDVGVLGYHAVFTETSTGHDDKPPTQVAALFQDYDARIAQFTFSHDAITAPDERLKLQPTVDAAAFQTPKGMIEFPPGDNTRPTIFELGHLEELETAYLDIKNAYGNLQKTQNTLAAICAPEIESGKIADDCRSIFQNLRGQL